MQEQTKSRIEKLAGIQRNNNIDAFIISSPSSLMFFSGYFFYFEYGPSPFQLLPALLVVPGHDATLVIADNEAGPTAAADSGITIIPYTSYSYSLPLSFIDECLKSIDSFFKKNNLAHARVGIEKNSIPFSVVQALMERYPLIEWVDVTGEISYCKAVKDKDEIESIRLAARLADCGQAAVLRHARAGLTELELFNLVRADIEGTAGHRVPLMADLSSGSGTASGGGMPTNKLIHEGDLILSDFTPCLNGYWGDSCNTIAVGQATTAQERTFKLVKEALEIGINAIRPGVPAKTIDAMMRNHIGNYPHHSGHGVGTNYHEEPRIVPYNEQVLLPDMVIALEPAIYEKEYGIRLEHLVVVTETGCEILTKFQHRFKQ